MCLAQGPQRVTQVRFEPVAPRSQVKHPMKKDISDPIQVDLSSIFFVLCTDIYHHIIIGFLINVQVQGQHPHQWAPFQVTG